MITTVICMRAPGMTMWRLPIFTWAILVTSILVLIAFPVLTAALLGLAVGPAFRVARVRPGQRRRDPLPASVLVLRASRGVHRRLAVLRHHLRGDPGVLPETAVRVPRHGVRACWASRRCPSAVWAHHMFATGAVLLPFFSFMTFLIAIPTGLKFFNWIGTMWKGQVSFETPMLFACGFLVTFLFGGLTGVILAAPALDFHVSDSLFRGRAFPLRAVRHHRVRHLRGDLLLVPEDDRPVPGRAARPAAFLGHVHRVPPDVPDPALAGQHRDAAPLPGLPADRRVHHVQHDLHHRVRSCWAPRRCRSSGTSSGPGGTARSPPRTTRGATATRWSGRPVHRRRGTTSPRCRGSGPSGRRSNCTTRTWSTGCGPRRTRTAAGSRCRPAESSPHLAIGTASKDPGETPT